VPTAEFNQIHGSPPWVETTGPMNHAPVTASADMTTSTAAIRRHVPDFNRAALYVSVMGNLPISEFRSRRHASLITRFSGLYGVRASSSTQGSALYERLRGLWIETHPPWGGSRAESAIWRQLASPAPLRSPLLRNWQRRKHRAWVTLESFYAGGRLGPIRSR